MEHQQERQREPERDLPYEDELEVQRIEEEENRKLTQSSHRGTRKQRTQNNNKKKRAL